MLAGLTGSSLSHRHRLRSELRSVLQVCNEDRPIFRDENEYPCAVKVSQRDVSLECSTRLSELCFQSTGHSQSYLLLSWSEESCRGNHTQRPCVGPSTHILTTVGCDTVVATAFRFVRECPTMRWGPNRPPCHSALPLLHGRNWRHLDQQKK